MKHLIILGAGGMGKEYLYTAKNAIGYGIEFDIKGFLDFPNPNWDTSIYPPIICHENDYVIEPDDVFICSIGDVHIKKKICEKMKCRGAHFLTIIHKEAQIRQNVNIGDGTMIDWNASVGSDVIIGENCLIQMFSIIGHDCRIGNYARIDTHAVCVGGVVVKDCATVHTGSVVSHKVTVNENATVGAMSLAIRNVKEGVTVQGSPARKLEF